MTQCGPTPAGFCMKDQTIAFSADFLKQAESASTLGIPFLVGHEIAHSIILSGGSPHRHLVLHELAADCVAGQLIGRAYGLTADSDEDSLQSMAKYTHSIGDPMYMDPDHHGFGAQRFIAYYVGVQAGLRLRNGDSTHAGDCVVFFYD